MINPRISIPTWVPETVKELIQQLEQPDLAPELRNTLERMTSDARMRRVWTALLSRDRASGELVYPALNRQGPRYRSKGNVQLVALTELFHFVFTAT
jgi:hypothetical protein